MSQPNKNTDKNLDSLFNNDFDALFDNQDELSHSHKAMVNKLHARRVDDSLITLLSEVLACNSEYSKSVAVLLDSETIKTENLERVQEEIEKLLPLLEKLLETEGTILERIENSQNTYKEHLEDALQNLQESQETFISDKFKAMFTKMGLKEDGTEHPPTDKIVIAVKNMLNNKILIAIATYILWYFVNYVVKIKGL